MYTDQEVLETLRKRLSPDELAGVIGRLLRVPEAWATLHDPAFLEQVVATDLPADLTPSALAALNLGGSIGVGLQAALADPHRDRTALAWEQAETGAVLDRDLFEVGLLGIEFARRAGSDSDPGPLFHSASASPLVWASPLAVAWTLLPDPTVVLRNLIDDGASHVAVQIALSNLPPEGAVRPLMGNANGTAIRLLQEITSSGEHGLAQALSVSSQTHPDSLAPLLIKAIGDQSSGAQDDARRSLQSAWDIASENAAQVADFTGDQAKQAQDPVTELEARRRALEIMPTPVRRARTAVSLLNLERGGEAISLLSGSEQLSIEELIASGMANAQPDPSGEQFKRALSELKDHGRMDDDWFVMLIGGLQGAGEWSAAVDAAAARIDRYPASSQARIGFANALLEAGDLEHAAEQADLALALDPGSPELMEPFEHRYDEPLPEGEADPETARQKLTEAVQVDPSDAPAHISLAKQLRSMGHLSEALEAAKAAAELDGEDTDISLELADVLLELGHMNWALDVLRTVSKRRPLSWKVALAQAKALERRGDVQRATRVIRPLPPSAPPKTHLEAARISLAAGVSGPALARTVQALEEVEQSGYQDPYLDYWYATALERARRFDEAIKRYEIARKGIPQEDTNSHEQAALGIARAACGLGQVSLALSTLENAQAEFPGSARVLASMADTYQFAKLPDKAHEMADQAVELDPEDPSAWQALGVALAETGDFNGSVRAIERLSALDPTAVRGWMELAQLASSTGHGQVARRALAEALWRGRRNPEALEMAARFQRDTGATSSAVRIMVAANRQRPDDPTLLSNLAELLESAGELQAAYETWTKCIELAPHDPEPLRNAGQCAARLGWREATVSAFEKAVALDPRNAELRRDLAAAYVEHGKVRKGLGAYVSAVKEAPNDAVLAREAVEAALLAGDPRQALGLVGRMRALTGDNDWIHAALGEAYLLLDKADKAEASLVEAIEQGFSSVRTFAMLAVATKDYSVARDYLDQARGARVGSAHGAIWASRAELRFFNWPAALEALEGWTHPSAVLERARSALRVRDAHWLLQVSDASTQPPPSDLADVAVTALDDLASQEFDESLLAPVRWWSRPDKRLTDGKVHLEHDPTGWIGEALAIAHLKAGRHAEAREATAMTRQVCSRAEWCDILDGLAYEAEGLSEDARAAYRKAHSSNPLASYLLGRSYAQVGGLERAVKHVGAAVIAMPEEHIWQYKLASIYLELDEPDSALAHLQEAAAGEPEQPTYLLALAKAYRECGQRNEALAAYRAALEFETDSVDAFREAGQIALEAGLYDQASQWFERACTLAPSDVSSLIGSAQAEMARGRKQLASERLNSAVRLAPGDPAVLLGRGRIQALSADYDAALSSYADALEAGADPMQVHHSRSKALAAQGKNELASQALREALQDAPDDHRLWHQLGLILEAVSDYRSAEEALSEAVRISPMNSEYRLSLARIARKAGNLDRAIEELRQGGHAAPKDPRISVETGLVYEDRRDYSRALEAYGSAIQTDPNCVEAYYRAGLLLRTLKSYKRAGEMLKHAADLAPVNKDVLHQLAAVRALELVHG